MSDDKGRREFLQAAGVVTAGLVAAVSPIAAAEASPAAAAAVPSPPKTMGGRFRELLQRREPFETIATYDVFTARMIEELGFPALYMGGSLTGDFYAQPVWLNDMVERVEFVGHIAQNVGIPTMADMDDGGDPMMIYRYTKLFERAGAGAVLILDAAPGPAGTVNGVIPVEKMVDKIHAACDSRAEIPVTVRCGAAGANSEGKDKAIERAIKYAEAGAETVWFAGIVLTDVPKIADAIKIPVTFQIAGNVPIADAKASRVTCAIYASLLQNIAHSAVYDALVELKQTGMMAKAAGSARLGGHLPPEFRAKVTRTDEIAANAKKYHVQP
jgi:methylisocitrate lyase